MLILVQNELDNRVRAYKDLDEFFEGNDDREMAQENLGIGYRTCFCCLGIQASLVTMGMNSNRNSYKLGVMK